MYAKLQICFLVFSKGLKSLIFTLFQFSLFKSNTFFACIAKYLYQYLVFLVHFCSPSHPPQIPSYGAASLPWIGSYVHFLNVTLRKNCFFHLSFYSFFKFFFPSRIQHYLTLLKYSCFNFYPNIFFYQYYNVFLIF